MKQEITKILKSKMLVATFVAIVILPLIYGGLYLWSFWDPYAKMSNLPVAIVNEDICQKKDGEEKCFGQDLINELKDDTSIKWTFVGRKEAEAGLQNKKYYTEAIIPSDFTKNILSVDSGSPKKANIEFKSRGSSSFMASKFTTTAFDKIKAKLNEKISKGYFDNIFSEERDSVFDLNNAATGSAKLADGVNNAATGSADLYDGIDKEYAGVSDLKNGLYDLYYGSVSLNDGANKAYTGSISLVAGENQISAGLSGANSAINNLIQGNSSMQGVVDGIANGNSTVITEINAYIAAHPEASASPELQTALNAASGVDSGLLGLKNGLTQSGMGLSGLSTGINTLIVGTNSINAGLYSLNLGLKDLATGSASLKDNLLIAKDGSDKLVSGILDIKSGSFTLKNGLNDALFGAKELADKLFKSFNDNRVKTDKSINDKQSEVLSAPVSIHDISIDIVNNNGTGFAPYFIPLALWVGSMAIFFLVDLTLPDKKKVKTFIPKSIVAGVVAIVQALTLDLVMILALGLKVNNIWGFVGFTMLLSLMSMFVQMFLTISMGLAGKFVGIILLMLQLTSSGGSYPIETSPAFFQNISPYLPMTYAVSALRELVSGDNLNIAQMDARMILIMGLIFIAFTLFYIGKPFKLNKRYAKRKNK